MKISFSTLGCPEWSWDDMLSTAKDLGFNGIEVRGIENELYVPKSKPFSVTNIEGTKARLNKLGLEIPCLTSACYLFDKAKKDFYINEGKEYIDIAQKLGTPFVRVLGDANPEPGNEIDFCFVADNLKTLTEYAKDKNVKILIETNGIFADSEKMLELVKAVDNTNLGVLWDIHHPFRFMNEPVEKTYAALKDYIMFIHMKDSKVEEGKIRYKMLGYGDVPVRETLELLKKNKYDGFVSLEWVKRWCVDLEDPGVVFSHYAYYIRDNIK
ncbi:MAG: sugar phosphate isomerase/epimerase [Clostridia bacterium]|nr:sugar phosphate isomerase/epimerase [Clostridia bacterium]